MGMSYALGDAAVLGSAADAVRRYLAVVEGGGFEPAQLLADVEDGFVRHAASYSRWKQVSHRQWYEAGVPVDVLMRAGILGLDN